MNPIANASFENVKDAAPEGWKAETYGGRAQFEAASPGRTGLHSGAISSTRGADAAWTQAVEVLPDSRYRLSAWIKTENVVAGSSRGALLNVHGIDGAETGALTGTKDWTRVELVFDTRDMNQVQVNCLFGGWGRATGKAWYDDMALEWISTEKKAPLTELKPSVVIDAARTREPISKYIYGQFIEHLGRCIYGGIWAEMLEDRKFFYAVNENTDRPIWRKTGEGADVLARTPWMIMGPAANVRMSKTNPCAGEHVPEVVLAGEAGGLAQGELALQKGKAYTGRVVLAGDASAAPVEVSLVWGEGASGRQTIKIEKITGDFQKTSLGFKAGAATDDGRIEILGKGKGTLRIGAVSLMPADNLKGWRRDTVERLRELDSPVYRWPGGNFVSGYNWRDGLGDPDRRPPRKNPAWTGIEHNDVGVHEFLDLCALINTEPYIAVNAGLGGAEEAAREVEYVNGAPDTAMGKLRAENGRVPPWGCKWWSIGNEMYGGWQLGHVPLEEFVKRHNQFAEAMRAADPKIQLVAVGNADSGWTKTMFENCSDHMDLVSEHFYCPESGSLRAHAALVPDAIKHIADLHRQMRKTLPAVQRKNIRIAMDEWNHWYGPHPFGELGTRYFLKDALGIARGLHEYYRNSDLFFMANYAQTVNVIGCIKTNKTAAEMETTGLVLEMYRRHYGVTPVEAGGAPEPLDVAAAWTQDGRTLTVGVVNPTNVRYKLRLDLKGARLTGKGRAWEIAGNDPKLYNDPGQPRRVDIVEKEVRGASHTLEIAPISATLFALPTRE